MHLFSNSIILFLLFILHLSPCTFSYKLAETASDLNESICFEEPSDSLNGNKSKSDQYYSNKIITFSSNTQLKDEVLFAELSLGEINSSKTAKYNPIFSIDGKRIFFCMVNSKSRIANEDIYYSQLIENEWTSPQPYTEINSAFNEAPNYFFKDDQKCLIFGDLRNSQGSGDLYIWEMINGRANTSLLPRPINTEYFEGDGFFFNDTILFFTSDRPGVIGDMRQKRFAPDKWGNTDIFISFLKNNSWTPPINLGPTINTDKAERSPFLSSDGKYLFFSSSGHENGKKNLDIYVSFRLYDSSWFHWSQPINLGEKINSGADEWGFNISRDNNFCTFSQNQSIKLFSLLFDITDENNFSNVFTKKPYAEYIRSYKKEILPEPIIVQPSEDITLSEIVKSVTDSSAFLIPLKSVSNPPDFIIDTTKNTIYVYFDFDEAKILPSQESIIDSVISFLINSFGQKELKLEISISGHTDSKGSINYNKGLSLKRALTVKNLLITRGLNNIKYKILALGESMPLEENNTESGRRKNRRVEIAIIYK